MATGFIWLEKLANVIWYEGISKQYEPQKFIIYNIKWNQNMSAGSRKPADYMDIIDQLENKKSSLYIGSNVAYSESDVVNYFIKDGLSAQGNHNGFMKLSGYVTGFDAGFDFAKLINPIGGMEVGGGGVSQEGPLDIMQDLLPKLPLKVHSVDHLANLRCFMHCLM